MYFTVSDVPLWPVVGNAISAFHMLSRVPKLLRVNPTVVISVRRMNYSRVCGNEDKSRDFNLLPIHYALHQEGGRGFGIFWDFGRSAPAGDDRD